MSATANLPMRHTDDALVYHHVGSGDAEGYLRIVAAPISPAYELGLQILRRTHTVLLGMSIGNGFFSRKRVEIAVAGFAHSSGNLATLVPDTIAMHTYRALGYTEQQSQAYVRKYGNSLKNRCQSALTRARMTAPHAKLRSLDWNRDIAGVPGMQAAITRVGRLFETHATFRKDTLETTESVLASKVDSGASIAANALAEGVRYLLNELAFISICRSILDHEIVIPYYKPFVVGARFCEGAYGESVPGVGWIQYDIELSNTARLVHGGHHAE